MTTADRPAPVVPDDAGLRERALKAASAAADAYYNSTPTPDDMRDVVEHVTDAVLAVVGQVVTAETVAVVERIHEDRPVITARVYAPESWAHLELGTHLRAAVRSGEKEG